MMIKPQPKDPPRLSLQVSHSACVMTTAVICKLLRSKEATATVDIRNWPPVLDTGIFIHSFTSPLNLNLTCLQKHSLNNPNLKNYLEKRQIF